MQACPSGALSLAAEEHETRVRLDQDREPAVEVSKDGPYRITRGIPLLDARREPVPRKAGACLEHYSLPSAPEFRAAFVSYIEWGSRIAVENSTPGATPPQHMPVPRWWWVCEATPGSRVSALATDHDAGEDQQPVRLPAADEEPRFTAHIKPLFRTKDRQAMRFAFDLWSHDDVSRDADAILARLRAGTMPCDGAWPPERIDAVERWMAAGTPP